MAKRLGVVARFERGGGGVYTCDVCGRRTRRSENFQNSTCCAQCFELAGWDNHHNDSGTVPTAAEQKLYDALLAEIVKAGGDAARVKGCNTYLWRQPEKAEATVETKAKAKGKGKAAVEVKVDGETVPVAEAAVEQVAEVAAKVKRSRKAKAAAALTATAVEVALAKVAAPVYVASVENAAPASGVEVKRAVKGRSRKSQPAGAVAEQPVEPVAVAEPVAKLSALDAELAALDPDTREELLSMVETLREACVAAGWTALQWEFFKAEAPVKGWFNLIDLVGKGKAPKFKLAGDAERKYTALALAAEQK